LAALLGLPLPFPSVFAYAAGASLFTGQVLAGVYLPALQLFTEVSIIRSLSALLCLFISRSVHGKISGNTNQQQHSKGAADTFLLVACFMRFQINCQRASFPLPLPHQKTPRAIP